MGATLAARRFNLQLVGAFATAALFLAVVGIYAVAAFAVTTRRREFGIRSALGATRSEIVRGVLRNGLVFTAIGVALGVFGASATSRLLETLLFGISRADPATYVAVIVLLVTVAAIACWGPARRAGGVDPAITLRMD